MAAKNNYAKQERLLYIKRVTRRVCRMCDETDEREDCQKPRHRMKVVERWICEICDEEHISKAGVIRHMMEEHERKQTTFTDRSPRTICECGEEFLTSYQYYKHRTAVHDEQSGKGVQKRGQKEDQKPEPKRVRKPVSKQAEFKDLHAKVMSQINSRD